jgi:hypothetical protein
MVAAAPLPRFALSGLSSMLPENATISKPTISLKSPPYYTHPGTAYLREVITLIMRIDRRSTWAGRRAGG